jgi:hypothetical protein
VKRLHIRGLTRPSGEASRWVVAEPHWVVAHEERVGSFVAERERSACRARGALKDRVCLWAASL